MSKLVVASLMVAFCASANAQTYREAAPAVDDPVVEAKVLQIAAELRCLVCQNQTLAESDASLAQDLRAQMRTMLRAGDGEAEVQRYMTDRYGDFVLYRPPFNARTFLLWCGPGLLLAAGMGAWFGVMRRRGRLGAESFEPEPSEVFEAETWNVKGVRP